MVVVKFFLLRLCFEAFTRWPNVLLNFTIFEGGCGRPKRERVPDGGTHHPRDLEEGGSFIACKFVRTLSAATIGARRLDGPAPLKFDGLEQPASGSSHGIHPDVVSSRDWMPDHTKR